MIKSRYPTRWIPTLFFGLLSVLPPSLHGICISLCLVSAFEPPGVVTTYIKGTCEQEIQLYTTALHQDRYYIHAVTMLDLLNPTRKTVLVSLFIESILFGKSDSAKSIQRTSSYSKQKYSGFLTVLFAASSYIIVWKKKMQSRNKVILAASVVAYLLAMMVGLSSRH